MMTTLNHVTISNVEMLIRKPVEEVFEAFIDPAVTTKFWFTKSTVEWIFILRSENETLVKITNSGFKGDQGDIVKQVIDSTGGFTIVLCGLKALLEHNIVLNLVADRFPDAHVSR